MFFLNPHSKAHEGCHKLDDFDNPNSWTLSEIDLVREMGFDIDGDTHLSLKANDADKVTEYRISKLKQYGYCLEINSRKYVFKTFNDMMKKIDEAGKVIVDH